jgi:ribonuclease HII
MGQGPTLDFEDRARRRGARAVAGVDEAGRGPLAGPVVAAAVILKADDPIDGVDDSKKLSPARREALFAQIHARARSVGVGIVPAREIDAGGILPATRRAMTEAVRALGAAGAGIAADHLLIDALTLPDVPLPQDGIIRGDQKSASIAAASIVAKVTRDRLMAELDARHPGYGFRVHKGYPTRAHREAIQRLGPCEAHRRSFRGVPPAAPA